MTHKSNVQFSYIIFNIIIHNNGSQKMNPSTTIIIVRFMEGEQKMCQWATTLARK